MLATLFDLELRIDKVGFSVCSWSYKLLVVQTLHVSAYIKIQSLFQWVIVGLQSVHPLANLSLICPNSHSKNIFNLSNSCPHDLNFCLQIICKLIYKLVILFHVQEFYIIGFSQPKVGYLPLLLTCTSLCLFTRFPVDYSLFIFFYLNH